MKIRLSFTLIELLTVVAIIALLAGLLLPSLHTAKEKSRSLSCMNNLKQIGIGAANYVQDNDGWASGMVYWPHYYDEYLTNRPASFSYLYVLSPVWRCPSNPCQCFIETVSGLQTVRDSRCSYIGNSEMYQPSWTPPKLTQVRNPSSKILVLERNDGQWGTVAAYGTGSTDYYGFPHIKGMNLLFMDFHVNWWPMLHQAFSGGGSLINEWWLCP